MSAVENMPTPRKVCFVTIGATAGFDALIRATLSSAFLAVLRRYGYTDLRLQYGKDGRPMIEDFEKRCKTDVEYSRGINVGGLDFKKQGLGAEMRAANGEEGSLEGVVISHAGMCRSPHRPTSVV